MNAFFAKLHTYGPYGLFILRLVLGLILIMAGMGKLGGGYFVGPLANMGTPIPVVLGPIVTLVELIGGILLVLGLFSRYVSALLFIEWVIIIVIYRLLGPLGSSWGDIRLDLLILAAVVVLLTNGSGRPSVGKMLGRFDP